MPIFQYKAFAPGGGTQTGVIDADSSREARSKLRKESLLVSEIKEMRGGTKRAKASKDGTKKDGLLSRLRAQRAMQSGPSSKELDIIAGVTRQLATMLASGIPLAESLRALIEQAESRRMETLWREVRESVSQGASFADALAEHPSMFTDLYVNMIRAGEATGNVDVVLSRLADYLQTQRALRRKVVSALTYPVMMIALGILVVIVLMTFVVPKITDMLLDQGQTLPTPTLILITISGLFKNYWWVGCTLIAIISFFVERVYKHSDGGRLFIDRNLLKSPVIGDLLKKQAVARFTRTLSTLLRSGVAAVQSLEITETVVGNRVIADATKHIRERIVEGTDIAGPLKQTGAFPPVVGYMVSVGEQSGELEQMLDRIAVSYDEEIEVATERMTAMLEPIMIMALAIVVGYIVVSIVLPILQVGNIQ